MTGMIHITLRAEGALANVLGKELIEYGLAKPAYLCNLTELIYLKYPAMADFSGKLKIAINGTVAPESRELTEGDEVTLTV